MLVNKRSIFIGIAAISTLVVSLYLALPWVVQTLVKNILADQQIELKAMEFERPSWANLSSGNFQLDLLSLRLEDKAVLTILDALISLDKSAATFGVVTIESIHIQREESSTTGAASDAVDLSSLLPNVLLSGLPEAQLMVNSLTVNQPDIELKKLNVNLSGKALTAQAILNYRLWGSSSDVLTPLNDVDVSLSINAMNELRFNVKAAGAKPLLQLKLGLTKRDSFLQGNMQLNSSLGRVNFPVAEGAVVSLNKNHLSSVTEFSLPAKQVLSVDKISQFTALSTVHYTAIIAGQNKKRTTQLSADATVEYFLNNGLMGISLMANKEPLLQAKGHVRQVVFSSEGRRQRGAVGTLLTNIKEPIGLEYNWQANTEEGLLVTGGELALKYIEKSKSLVDVQISNMKLNMPDSGAELEGSVQLKGQVDLAHIRNPLAIEGLSIESLNAVINTRVDIQGNQLTIKALSKNVLRAGSVRLNEHAGKAVSISIPKQAFNISLETGNTSRFEFSLNGSNLSSDAFSMKELGLQTNANIKNNTINIHSTSAAVDANVSGKSYYIPPMVVKSSLKLKNSTVSKASFKIENMCNDPLLAVNWQPTKQMGDLVEIRWKQRFSNKKTLRKWLNTSQLPFDVTQGVFAGHVSISLGADDVKLRKLNVSVNNVDGIYGAGTFEGVQLQLSSNLQKLKLNETKQVVDFDTLYADIDGTVKQLNMGVKANNIVIKTAVYDALNEWHLKIPLLQANVFSGLAEVRDENINLSSDMQLDLILKQLDLSKLVETQGMEGLRATGKLSGRIPIQYANGKFNVLNGEMTSSKSGQIRYITPLSQSTNINEQLKLTLDVLENFNYTRLNSTVVYDDDTLYLKSTIAGNNPDVANGRLINLNLNTEVGLKGALEAMRIQAGIDSRIEAFVGSKVTASNNQYFCQ